MMLCTNIVNACLQILDEELYVTGPPVDSIKSLSLLGLMTVANRHRGRGRGKVCHMSTLIDTVLWYGSALYT